MSLARTFGTAGSSLRTPFERLSALRKGRSARQARVRAALERFPSLSGFDRDGLVRQIGLTNSATAMMFRIIAKMPHVAKRIARFVPIVGNLPALTTVPNDRPIILAGRHLGSTYFVITVISRLFSHRNFYVLDGGAPNAATARYLRAIGKTPVERGGGPVLRKLSDILATDSSAVLWVAFDSMSGGNRRGRRMDLEFLGAPISVPMGLAYLARFHRTPTISVGWEFSFSGPRVRIGEVHQADHALEPGDCEQQLTRRLFAELELQVLKAPHEWTEWADCCPDFEAAH